MKLEEIRSKAPTLVLDAGNALFQVALDGSEPARKKAEFIVKTMGDLKTTAMAVGLRDLNAGPAWLKEQAVKAKLPVLSANLMQDKKRVFDASRVVSVGGVKVGLVGVGPKATFGQFPGLVGEPPVPAALAEAKKLKGKVDLVVVLAALPYADALELARDGQGTVDLVLQSGDSRAGGPPQAFGNTFLVAGGERGRMLVRVDLDLSGNGPLVDAGALERQKQTLALLDQQLTEAKRRKDAAKEPAQVKQFEEVVKSFEQRKAQVAKEVEGLQKVSGKTLATSLIMLESDVPSDPSIKAEVDKLQPPSTL